MTDQNSMEQWQAMSQPFSLLPFSLFMGSMQRSAHMYWKAQAQVLDDMHTLAEGWFQRRHAGVRAAQEACERMCEAKTPGEWHQACQTWSSGAMQRLMADGMVFQEGMKKIADETTSLVPEIAKEQGEVVAAAARNRTRNRATM